MRLLISLILLLQLISWSTTSVDANSSITNSALEALRPPLSDLHQYLCSTWRPHHRIEQVVVSFVLNRNGKVSQAKIERSCGVADCDAEAVAIVNSYAYKRAWPASVPDRIRIQYSLLGRAMETKRFTRLDFSSARKGMSSIGFESLPPVLKTFKVNGKEQFYFYGQVGLNSITPVRISK